MRRVPRPRKNASARLACPTARICITGGSGFIGTALLRALILRGYPKQQLTVIDPAPPSKEFRGKVRYYSGDLADPRVLRRALRDGDIVVHLGGTSNQATSQRDPRNDALRNIGGTLMLLEQASKKGIAKFVFPSSAPSVYGTQRRLPVTESARCDPIAVYGAIKLSLEYFIAYFARVGHFPYVILRAANVYGPGQFAETHGVVSRFAIRALTDRPIDVWGPPTTARDFVYVDDFIEALLRSIERPVANLTLNIASGRATTLASLIAAVERSVGKRARVRYRSRRPIDVPVTRFNPHLARTLLGWHATTSVDDGVAQTVQWLRERLGPAARPPRVTRRPPHA
jgi:UDP-glucose 4-epimerase